MYSVGSYDTYGGVHVGLVCACMVLVVILSVLSVAACDANDRGICDTDGGDVVGVRRSVLRSLLSLPNW